MVNLGRTVASLATTSRTLVLNGRLLFRSSQFYANIPKIKCLSACFIASLHDNKEHTYEDMRKHSNGVEGLAHFYSHYLAGLLKCAPSSGLVMISKNAKILKLQPEDLRRNACFLTSNFQISEILEHPELLSIPKVHMLYHRIQLLKELGFSPLTLDAFANLKAFMKLSIGTLKELHLLPNDVEPVELLLQCLDCPTSVKDAIRSSQPIVNPKNSSILSIRESIFAHYLLWKLGTMEGKKNQKILSTVKYVSIHYLVEVLQSLRTDFGLNSLKIYSLLQLTPNQLRDIVSNAPVLAGMDIKTIVDRDPHILFVSAEDLKATERILLDYGITNAQMLTCLPVFKLKPSQVQYRLNLLSTKKGFDVWSKTRLFLKALLYLDGMQDHLKVLGEKNVLSLDVLVPQIIHSPKVMSDTPFKKAKATISFLSDILKKSETDIKENLGQHPNARSLSLQNTKHVLDMLTKYGMTKEQVWAGLPVVLYDQDVVQEQLELMPNCEEAQPLEYWKNHPNFLQLVMYCLEKQCGFSGDASYYVLKNPC